MTMIEKIAKDRAWRGASVGKVYRQGRHFGYRLRHPSGAEATILREPGDMDSRKWMTWVRKRECERCGICLNGHGHATRR